VLPFDPQDAARPAPETATPDPLEAMRERLERHERALRTLTHPFLVSPHDGSAEDYRRDSARKALGAEGE
jgi:hypothetical protein